MKTLQVVSPVDGSTFAERPLATWDEVDAALARATAATASWQDTPLDERIALTERFAAVLDQNAEEWGPELSWQMGRPVRFAGREITTAADRARRMANLASTALTDVAVDGPDNAELFIRKVPLGVVLVIPAWNYPYLIAVNSVVPALLAGNSVVLKHSSQTPLCSERLAAALAEAGLPDGVFHAVHTDHTTTERAVADKRVAFVAFTGSVHGGHTMVGALANRFVGCGLELGGKDPAYVRVDADLDHAIENLVDGSFFNSGQSCCGIERIYVERSNYQAFVDGFVDLTRKYQLGNPLNPETDLGPVVRAAHADFVRAEVASAVSAGGRALIDPSDFMQADGGTYLAPQVLVDVDHSMSIMREETFGPVVGIMAVDGDEQAIQLMNDSPYGLTASVWTSDRDAAVSIGNRVDTGTWFMNRCDYLDPGLAWVGVKDSGRGCTLSVLGFDQLTRPKSYHLVRK